MGILEIKKLIPFLVLNYDVGSFLFRGSEIDLRLTKGQIRIVDSDKFEVENSWFFFQRGLYARIQKRPQAAEDQS